MPKYEYKIWDWKEDIEDIELIEYIKSISSNIELILKDFRSYIKKYHLENTDGVDVSEIVDAIKKNWNEIAFKHVIELAKDCKEYTTDYKIEILELLYYKASTNEINISDIIEYFILNYNETNQQIPTITIKELEKYIRENPTKISLKDIKTILKFYKEVKKINDEEDKKVDVSVKQCRSDIDDIYLLFGLAYEIAQENSIDVSGLVSEIDEFYDWKKSFRV